MNWIELLQNLGFFSAAVAALTFIAKKLIEKSLDRSLEKYKITFSKLHNDRAEVIRAIYEKLVLMDNSMRDYMSPLQLGGISRDQKKDKAGRRAQEPTA